MSQVFIKQIRSAIGRNPQVKDTLKALGLGRIGSSKQIPLNPAVQGMLNRIKQLIVVEPVKK